MSSLVSQGEDLEAQGCNHCSLHPCPPHAWPPLPSLPHLEVDPVSHSLKTIQPEAPPCLSGAFPSPVSAPTRIPQHTLSMTTYAPSHSDTEPRTAALFKDVLQPFPPINHLSVHKSDAFSPNLMHSPGSWLVLSQLLLISLPPL